MEKSHQIEFKYHVTAQIIIYDIFKTRTKTLQR